MPSGRDGAKLRQWMNETQMLFHGHPVNAARIASSLGLPEYSYYFVLRDFLPALQRLGDVVIVETVDGARASFRMQGGYVVRTAVPLGGGATGRDRGGRVGAGLLGDAGKGMRAFRAGLKDEGKPAPPADAAAKVDPSLMAMTSMFG